MEGCKRPFGEPVTSDDFISLRIPNYDLETSLVFEVEMVEVAWSSASSSDSSERYFTQTSYFPEDVGSSLVVDYIYLVVSSVSVA